MVEAPCCEIQTAPRIVRFHEIEVPSDRQRAPFPSPADWRVGCRSNW
jgi:hypothetical protein